MILIKIGGGKELNIDNVCKDIAELVEKKEKVIIVHGASETRDEIARSLKSPTRVLISPSGVSSVYTDQEAIDIFLMAYAGLINKRIVANLQKYGVNAIGLSGIDGRLWEAKRKDAVYSVEEGKTKLITDNLTGKVVKTNKHLINLLVRYKYTPVICPPAISEESQIVNTDNDFATAVMVEDLKIKKMISLFAAPGLLRDVDDPKSLIRKMNREELHNYLQFAQGRMKKKLLGAENAFTAGLKIMYWGDGRVDFPLRKALSGAGTIIF